MKDKIISLEKDWMAFIYALIGILLLFDPFEHFTFHVRILGLEMLSYLFVRKHSIRYE